MKHQTLSFVVIIAGCIGVFAEVDPCFNYKPLNDSTRLSSYESDGITERPSDRLLPPGWYRNMHITEGDMMTICPNATQCGSNFPVWINGSLPKKAQTVTLKACKNTFGRCCGSTFDVRVKGCDGYNVYELVPMKTSSGRYCFYGPKRCPHGQTSATGFAPCSASPISFSASLRVEPSIPSHQFDSPDRHLKFTCGGISGSYRNRVFDILWDVEGIEVKRKVNLAYRDISTLGSLTENEWSLTGYKIGMHVKCAIRAKAQTNGVPTAFIHSPPFFAGFKVLDPNLSIRGGSVGSIRIQSTVPIACPQNHNLKYPCFITLEMFDLGEQIGDSATCQRNITQIEKKPASCGIKFNGWNWRSTHRLPVTTLVDQSYRSQYTAIIKLRVLANEFDKIWNDYIIPDIKVIVANPTSAGERQGQFCRAYNDPNIRTFDRKYSLLASVGEFVLYQHTTRPYAVHILTKNDRSYSFANCGVSVQAGADVFIVYGCDFPRKWIQKRFCTQSTQRLEVYEKNNGRNIEVHLPTGTRIQIDVKADFINVKIFISPSEWTKTRGLCGIFNGNQNDDFADRSGHVVNKADYEKAWSVLPGESLFVEKTRTAKLQRQYYFCDCVKNNISSTIEEFSQSTDCSWQDGTKLCPSLSWNAQACSTREKRDADGSDSIVIDAPLDFVMYKPPPANINTWKNGWNETAAMDFCTRKVMGLSSVQSCLKLTTAKPDESINMCVNDIKVSGGTKYLSGALESFQSVCKNEIKLNTTLLEPVSPGQKSPAEEIEALQCPGECEHDGEKRGTCTDGKCHCFANFAGPDCSIDVRSQPTLFPPSTNNICDRSKHYCGSMTFYGLNFNTESKLTCRLHISQVENGVEKSDGESTVGAVMETFSSIRCPLPDDVRRRKRSTTSVQHYTKILFSITNNMQNYSNTIPSVIYDSRCLACSLQNGQIVCSQKNNICVKHNSCYPLKSNHCSDTDDDDDDDDDDHDHNRSSNLWIIGAVLGGVALFAVMAVVLFKAYHKSKVQIKAQYMENNYEDLHVYNKPPAATHY